MKDGKIVYGCFDKIGDRWFHFDIEGQRHEIVKGASYGSDDIGVEAKDKFTYFLFNGGEKKEGGITYRVVADGWIYIKTYGASNEVRWVKLVNQP